MIATATDMTLRPAAGPQPSVRRSASSSTWPLKSQKAVTWSSSTQLAQAAAAAIRHVTVASSTATSWHPRAQRHTFVSRPPRPVGCAARCALRRRGDTRARRHRPPSCARGADRGTRRRTTRCRRGWVSTRRLARTGPAADIGNVCTGPISKAQPASSTVPDLRQSLFVVSGLSARCQRPP